MAEELFGVAHPDQLLMFPGALNPATQKLMKGGSEVPYQVDGSKIIVRAEGGIAANSSNVWSIVPGARSASPQVSVTDGGTYYEIDNGLIAVRTPKAIAVGTQPTLAADADPNHRLYFIAPSQILAPIQGIRHRDGTWTGTGPNYLYMPQTWHDPGANESLNGGNFPAKSGTVEIVENGPLRAKVRVTYACLRPAHAPSGHWDYWDVIYASDNGFYICTVTLEAGQQSIIVEQETDVNVAFSVNMNTGVSADRARYCSHGGLGMVAAQGHNYNGTVYESQDGRADIEAEVMLADTPVIGASEYYGRQPGFDYSDAPFAGVTYPPLALWYDWTAVNPWYWHSYNSAGASNSNMWGVFQGPASHFAGGRDCVYALSAYAKPQVGAKTEHGFSAYLKAWPDVNHVPRTRKFAFGIFLGSKGADVPVDFTASTEYGVNARWGAYSTNRSGIKRAYNLHSGTAALWKQIDQGLDFPDPGGGFPGMYLSRADTEALIANLAANQGAGSHYAKLYADDAGYREVWSAFSDVTNVAAAALVQSIVDTINAAVEIYVNRGDINCLWWAYWQGATRFQRLVVDCSAAISLNQVRQFLTTEQKRQIKAALSMTGHILWDNDFVPIDNYDGFSLGTGNMPVQFTQARYQIAVMLKDNPQFSARFADVLSGVTSSITTSISAYGAARDCPHYAGTLVIPATDVLRQLQVSGYADMFAPASSIYDRLTGLGEWCMQILSPPQSRFGGLRKMISYGDGASESHDMFLSLIMGLEAHDLTLSKRMAGAWAAMGQFMTSFYASSGLKICPNFPAQDPGLGDADFPGYMTVMRSAWGAANESAVFLMHGNDLVDHGGTAQRGTPQIYLLGAPVCICFGSMYSPKVSGPWVSCSTYIPVSEIGAGVTPAVAWHTATDLNLPCGSHSTLFSDTYTYEPTVNRVDLTCTFSVSGWVRHLTYYRDVLTQPIVRLRDSNTAGESVFTLHMMASGAVTKPDNTMVTPAALTGTPFAIANGACFKFTGQWGVSWDVYYFGRGAAHHGARSCWPSRASAGPSWSATAPTCSRSAPASRCRRPGPKMTIWKTPRQQSKN